MTAWFARLDPNAKAIGALLAALGVGFTLAFSLGGWFGLPTQVEANQRRSAANAAEIAEVKRTHQTLEGQVGDILCILTQPDGANPLDCI